MSSSFQSIVEVSKRLAVETPDRRIFTFVDDRGVEAATLTCKQVYERALVIAGELRLKHKLTKGERVLLVYPQGLEFVEAFLGCILAGIVPVPLPSPMPLRPEAGLVGYVKIAADCGASAQLTCQSYSRTRTFGRILLALKSGPKWPDLPWIVTDQMEKGATFEPENPSPQHLAFLQYTSGSTRAPRGVCLSHENIWEQTRLLTTELKLGRKESTAVFWMPHYHDFALIGGVINALLGIHHYISFSTTGFLRRPALWGELINRYRATHMGAPDFGYRLFTLQTTEEQRASWDFTPMVAAICAAEPIRAKTVDEFLKAFQVSKLAASAFCPSYGLAEHTVAVTLHGQKRFQVEGKEVFGCGRPGLGVQVRIVDLNTMQPVSDGSPGEIWVDSLSKSNGYFGQDEENQIKFGGKLSGSDQKFLRTGDLGAMMEGELVVLGRIDDMIIFRGKNIFPQDLEGIVSEGDKRVRPGRVIAFGIPGDEGKLVVVLELKDGHENEKEMNEIAETARALLQQELGIPQAILVFSPQGTIPKTSSGKLQRSKCRASFLDKTLAALKVDGGVS